VSKKSAGGSGIVEANPWRLPLFRELRERGAIDVLAHPTVQTATHRPASVLVGGEIPVRVKSSTGDFSIRTVPFGTRVEVRAVVLPNQRIRLQTAVELTKIIGDGVIDDDGTAYPGIVSRQLNTEVEMQLGQTLAIGRLVFDRPVDAGAADEQPSRKGTIRPVAHSYAPAESVETVVFITPRLAQGTGAPQAMPIRPTADSGDSDEANVPADFSPTDWDVFGPVVPVLKRRTGRQ
jgi:pilus assembly protein CpaC